MALCRMLHELTRPNLFFSDVMGVSATRAVSEHSLDEFGEKINRLLNCVQREGLVEGLTACFARLVVKIRKLPPPDIKSIGDLCSCILNMYYVEFILSE